MSGAGRPRALLRQLFRVAVAAADPSITLKAHLPTPPRGRTVVVGAGKAAARGAAGAKVPEVKHALRTCS